MHLVERYSVVICIPLSYNIYIGTCTWLKRYSVVICIPLSYNIYIGTCTWLKRYSVVICIPLSYNIYIGTCTWLKRYSVVICIPLSCNIYISTCTWLKRYSVVICIPLSYNIYIGTCTWLKRYSVVICIPLSYNIYISTCTWLKRYSVVICIPLSYNNNISVRCVYERMTFAPTLMTWVVSALWHGLYPGYHMSFIVFALATVTARKVHLHFTSIYLCIISIYKVRQVFWKRCQYPRRVKICYDIVTTVTTCFGRDFVALAFILLTFEKTLLLWR